MMDGRGVPSQAPIASGNTVNPAMDAVITFLWSGNLLVGEFKAEPLSKG